MQVERLKMRAGDEAIVEFILVREALSRLRASITLRVSEHDRTPHCVADVRFRKYWSE